VEASSSWFASTLSLLFFNCERESATYSHSSIIPKELTRRHYLVCNTFEASLFFNRSIRGMVCDYFSWSLITQDVLFKFWNIIEKGNALKVRNIMVSLWFAQDSTDIM